MKPNCLYCESENITQGLDGSILCIDCRGTFMRINTTLAQEVLKDFKDIEH